MIEKSDLEKLFEKAVFNLTSPLIKSSLDRGKFFELYALVSILESMKNCGYSVKAINPPANLANELTFAGRPAMADKSKYTYFEISKAHTSEEYEAWVSVEVTTLSVSKLAYKDPSLKAGYHEIDVALFKPLDSKKYRPSFEKLVFAASCKDTAFQKEHLREALGLRRETAYLDESKPSLAPWYIKDVPSTPPAPLVLYSRDSLCAKYKKPVDEIGVYLEYLKFP